MTRAAKLFGERRRGVAGKSRKGDDRRENRGEVREQRGVCEGERASEVSKENMLLHERESE
eukprot:6180215-Pleurochrysis_carterae.AAC.1